MRKQVTLREIELAISRMELGKSYDTMIKGYVIAEGEFTSGYSEGEIKGRHRKKIKIVGQIEPVWGTNHLTKFTMTELSGIAGSKGKLVFIPELGSRKKPLKEKYDPEFKGHILAEGEFTSMPIHIENGLVYGETIEVVGQEIQEKEKPVFKITDLSMIDGRKGKLFFVPSQDSKGLLLEPPKEPKIKMRILKESDLIKKLKEKKFN